LKGQPCQVADYLSKGKVVAQHVRFPDKTFTWRGKASMGSLELFGQSLWAEGGKRLVITEGEIDCMSIAMVYSWPVVSLPSGTGSVEKALKANMLFIASFNEIILAFDDDEPGNEAVEKAMLLLPVGKVKRMTYGGYKDANELFRAKGKSELVSRIYEAKQIRPDGIVNGKDLWEEIIKPTNKGYALPYPKLSAMLNGISKKKLYLFTAGSGIGKSTLVNEIAYWLGQEHGCKIGIMALEESTKEAAERYLSIRLNTRLSINKDKVSLDKLKEAYEATVGNGRYVFYNHWGSQNIDTLLSKIRFMAVAEGIDFLVLDHISIVVSGLDDNTEGGERKLIDKLMTKLRSLIEETHIGVLAIAHLKRPPGSRKSFNEGGTVSLTDLRGSGALEQLSDAVIAMERDQQIEDEASKNESRLRTLKNRGVGLTGIADTLVYNEHTGRLHLKGEEPYMRVEDNDDF
jgi:twinkle protein